MRLSAGLDAFVSHLALALVVAAGTLAAVKVVPSFSPRLARDLLAAAALEVVLGVAWAVTRRLPRLAGAMALDARHGLSDRIASALSFAALPEASRTPLMEVAIDDACRRAKGVSARRAVPIRMPRDLAPAMGLVAAVALIALLRVPVPKPIVHEKTIDPAELSADDLDLFRDAAKKLAERSKSPDVQAAIQQFNQLVEDIAKKRLDRTEAFRKLDDIQRGLMQGRAMDAKELDAQLKQRSSALKQSELVKPAAEALEKRDFQKAEKELKDLAKRMRDKPGSFDKGALERLREAMKKASESQQERMAALEQKRKEVEEQLLKQKQNRPDGGADDEEQRLLQRRERELERLDREKEQAERGGRQLDRLDRELSQAAEDILRELGISADDLDRGAEDINRLGREQMTDEEREELRQRLEDLREQLRQQGPGGQQQARLLRFSRRARGQGQGKGGQGQQGQRACPPDDPNCKPEDGEGEDGEGENGQGKDGQGQTLILGQGGDQKVLVMQRGGARSSGQGAGSGQGNQPGGEGSGQGGREAGHGHDPRLAGKATDPRMGTEDVQAEGLDTGQGATRSEVILGAAEKGFRGGAYKKVYTEYRTSAEQALHGGTIPPGATDHVRRYFDLIRPRE